MVPKDRIAPKSNIDGTTPLRPDVSSRDLTVILNLILSDSLVKFSVRIKNVLHKKPCELSILHMELWDEITEI